MFFLKKLKSSKLLFEKIDKAITLQMEIISTANMKVLMIRNGDPAEKTVDFCDKLPEFDNIMQEINELKNSGATIKRKYDIGIIESRIDNMHRLAEELADNLNAVRCTNKFRRIRLIIDMVIRRYLYFNQLVNQVKGDGK